jgi:hypothetical protein
MVGDGHFDPETGRWGFFMTDYIVGNIAARGKFRSLLKPRDIFVHDGKALRRVRISVPLQLSAAAAAVSTLCWSVFATASMVTAQPASGSDLARMEQEVQAMQADVAIIKDQVQQRYETTSAELRKLGIDPQRVQSVGGPFEAVEPLKAGDANFKALFTSWKKLDQLEQGTIAIPSLKPVKNANFTSGFGVRHSHLCHRRWRRWPVGLGRRLRQSGRNRPWQGYPDPVRASFPLAGPARTADQARRPDRADGIDRPLDRQPPPI